MHHYKSVEVLGLRGLELSGCGGLRGLWIIRLGFLVAEDSDSIGHTVDAKRHSGQSCRD